MIQGNNTGWDHNDSHFGQRFSWDFVRRCGTPVLASRSGTIEKTTVDKFDSFSPTTNDTNQVVVQQGDGTFAYYLHIRQGSVPVKLTPGTPVKAGDQIAKVGCVGRSLTGHIHFMVRPDQNNRNPTVAVVFSDVSDDSGIPRTFKTYTSRNRVVP